MKNVNGKGRK